MSQDRVGACGYVCPLEGDLAHIREVLDSVIAQNEALLDQLLQRDETLTAVVNELAALRPSIDQERVQLAAAEDKVDAVELRLRRLETALASRLRAAAPPGTPAPPPARPPAAATRIAAPVVAPELTPTVIRVRPAAAAPTAAPPIGASPEGSLDGGKHNGVTVIHVEDQAHFRDAIRAAADKWTAAYHLYDEPPERLNGRHRILALNLVHPTANPLDVITGAKRWCIDPPAAFAYCADGAFGFSFGLVDFIASPADPAVCAERLCGRSDRPQQILIVSEASEFANAVRDSLARANRATSIAFDSRQAIGLLPMTRPDLVLIDLSMPKGDALRLACRLRTGANTAKLAQVFFWSRPVDPEEFRQHAKQVIRDFPISPDTLARAMNRYMAPGTATAA